MGIECGICERDARAGHAPDCPRAKKASVAVPDGIYDNTESMARERWRNGKVEWRREAKMLFTKDNLPEKLTRRAKPWGHYPDLPAGASTGRDARAMRRIAVKCTSKRDAIERGQP